MICNFFLIFLITFRKTLFHFISSNFLVQSPRSDKTMEADLRAFLYGAPICLLFYLTFTKEFISYLDSCYQICYNNTKSTVKNITKYAQYIEEQCCTEKLGTQDDYHACSSNHWSTMQCALRAVGTKGGKGGQPKYWQTSSPYLNKETDYAPPRPLPLCAEMGFRWTSRCHSEIKIWARFYQILVVF